MNEIPSPDLTEEVSGKPNFKKLILPFLLPLILFVVITGLFFKQQNQNLSKKATRGFSSCPSDIPAQETSSSQINSYCQSAISQTCVIPNVWKSPLVCHSAPGWLPFGSSCQAPYCEGCQCISPVPPPQIPAK